MATKIRCRATDCIFNEDRFCTSDEIVYDPEEGCLTYEVLDELVDLDEEEEWEDDELLDEEDDDLEWDEEEDDDLFLDEDLDDDLVDDKYEWQV